MLKYSKFFFILQRCFTQYLLKSRNEMLLAAVAKVIGNRCPIWLVALADLFGRRQKFVTLEQPFEPNADVVPKKLLEPAFASAKRFGHGGNCLEAFIGFDGCNDLVDEFDSGIRLGMFRSNQLEELMNG